MLSEDSHFIFWIARTCPWLGGKNNFLKVKLYHRVIGGFPFHILNRRNIVSVVTYTQKRLKWNLFKNSFLLHKVIQFSSVQEGIYAFRKAHTSSALSLRSLPNVAFETVQQFSNPPNISQAFSVPIRRKYPTRWNNLGNFNQSALTKTPLLQDGLRQVYPKKWSGTGRLLAPMMALLHFLQRGAMYFS